MGPPASTGEQVGGFILQKLREDHPFLKQDTLEVIAAQCKQTISDRLEREGPRMQASHKRINSLTIPREIRSRICRLLLTVEESTTALPLGPDGKRLARIADFSESFNQSEKWTEQPPLTQVCKQLREKTLPVYYGANTFLFRVMALSNAHYRPGETVLYAQGAQGWLDSIGAKNRDLIKSVIVHNVPPIMQHHVDARVSGQRFGMALDSAGVALKNCEFRSYYEWLGWVEITSGEDNVGSEKTVAWIFD